VRVTIGGSRLLVKYGCEVIGNPVYFTHLGVPHSGRRTWPKRAVFGRLVSDLSQQHQIEGVEAPARSRHGGLGERVRQLRVAAGLTQSELAGERFSKEYVSQIERGKTRPTRETIQWLAARLGADGSFLEHGVSTDERERIEAALARAGALSESERFAEAVEEYDMIRGAVLSTGSAELEVRMLAAEAWARMRNGDVTRAIDHLVRARDLVEGPAFSDVDRADILYRLGACRWKLSSISTAISLFNEALALAEGSGLPCDVLRSNILSARSRCYRRQRDWEAAREDVERALELAQGTSDKRALAEVNFQASLIAERNGHWVLARKYAEAAKTYYEEIADEANVGRLLNNLGAFNFLLGQPEKAEKLLKDSFRIALEVGSETDAAVAVSSLAQIHLREGRPEAAEEQAHHALTLLSGRDDLMHEIGNAQLVLGRALLDQGRLDDAALALDDAERSLAQLSSASHRAAAWIAKGDLAVQRGDDAIAAQLYRKAAEALQDFHF
jgi:tetratricopeptide (TPR) repeat protein